MGHKTIFCRCPYCRMISLFSWLMIIREETEKEVNILRASIEMRLPISNNICSRLQPETVERSALLWTSPKYRVWVSLRFNERELAVLRRGAGGQCTLSCLCLDLSETLINFLLLSSAYRPIRLLVPFHLLIPHLQLTRFARPSVSRARRGDSARNTCYYGGYMFNGYHDPAAGALIKRVQLIRTADRRASLPRATTTFPMSNLTRLGRSIIVLKYDEHDKILCPVESITQTRQLKLQKGKEYLYFLRGTSDRLTHRIM